MSSIYLVCPICCLYKEMLILDADVKVCVAVFIVMMVCVCSVLILMLCQRKTKRSKSKKENCYMVSLHFWATESIPIAHRWVIYTSDVDQTTRLPHTIYYLVALKWTHPLFAAAATLQCVLQRWSHFKAHLAESLTTAYKSTVLRGHRK